MYTGFLGLIRKYILNGNRWKKNILKNIVYRGC